MKMKRKTSSIKKKSTPKQNQPEKLQSDKHTTYEALKPSSTENFAKGNLFEFIIYSKSKFVTESTGFEVSKEPVMSTQQKIGIDIFLCFKNPIIRVLVKQCKYFFASTSTDLSN